MAAITPDPVWTEDEAFFADHPDRKIRIRRPRHDGEFRREFRSLGPHQYDRRRLLVVRVAPEMAVRYGRKLVEIPFLAFADETIEDTDAVLLPIFREIMGNEAKRLGIGSDA